MIFTLISISMFAPGLAPQLLPRETAREETGAAAHFVWGDFDGDGLDDALAITRTGELRLLRNRGDGAFDEVGQDAGLGTVRAARFAVWEDYDGDGRLDLFVGTRHGRSQLLRNQGGGVFEDVAAASGLALAGDDRSAEWIDYDADGKLDLFVATTQANRVYHALGDGLFERVELGLPQHPLMPLGSFAGGRSAKEKDPAAPAPIAGARSGARLGSRMPVDLALSSLEGGGPLLPPSSMPLVWKKSCVDSIKDLATGGCLQASSTPTAGALFPPPHDGGIGNVSSGSISFVGGGEDNQATGHRSAVGGGLSNAASGRYALVAGGFDNAATDSAATVSGGRSNSASKEGATVGGGDYNFASGLYATVGGGSANSSAGYSAMVGGGYGNSASGYQAAVGGGSRNTSAGRNATVSGGYYSTASGNFATVGGGDSNVADEPYATVGGGAANNATGAYATIGGGAFNVADQGLFNYGATTVGGGYYNAAEGDAATVAGGYRNTASGLFTTVGGGANNEATGTEAAVGGGSSNLASGNRATVSGGRSNTAPGTYATVGGGYRNYSAEGATVGGGRYNEASADSAVVGGGYRNYASGALATVAGGYQNEAFVDGSSIGGGLYNRVYGAYSTIPGGFSNNALGNYGFAAGRRAKAFHQGAFVWGDSFDGDKPSSSADEFTVYCSGGARFFSNSAATTGVLLAPGGGSWSAVSDRDSKENVEPVDGCAVLERLVAMPLSTWNYKEQNDSVRHMGPMAQDFHAAFGLGVSDRLIDTIDPDGVALAAIQGLNAKLEESDKRLSVKDAEIEELRMEVAALRELVLAPAEAR